MSDEELAKDLGPLAALTIGVGTMVGAGIFVLPGPAAIDAGPLVVLSFVIGGGIAIFTALSASELGTAMPKAGGAYYYVNHALGPLFGSIAGWGNWLGLAFASAFYMLGFGEYVNDMLGGIVLSIPLIGGSFALQPSIDLVVLTLSPAQFWGFLAGALFVGVNYVGAKETGRLQNVIVVTLVAILAVFTAVGVLNADLSTLRPIESEWYGEILPVTALVFVSYLGFVQITSVGEEIKNPGRNLPLAVIGSVVIVTIIYAISLLVLFAVAELDAIAGNETAVVDAAGELMGPIGAAALLFGGLLATASSANASILSSSRINFAMGRDKIVSNWLNDIHDQFSTPYRSIALTGVLILVLVVIGDVETLARAGSVMHLIIYGLLNIALIVMREADVPEYDPDFTVPFYPFTPILGAVFSFALIGYMATDLILLSLLFVVAAALWYLLYARGKTEKAGILSQYILTRSRTMPDSAVSAADSVQPDAAPDAEDVASEYRVMVPISNPRTEQELITLASAMAKQRGGTVVAVHIVQVPDQTPLDRGAEHIDRIDSESAQLLAEARENAETFGVEVETNTVVSHRSFEEIFDAARTFDVDQVVMGWGPHSHGRAESRIDELTHNLPCDFFVLKDRGFDPSRILVPTAGGPDSELGAEVARLLRDEYGSEITLLHAISEDESMEEGEQFLADWAAEHGLEDAALAVEQSDVEGAIARAAEEHTMLVVGATERGLLSRLLDSALILDVIDEVECSVLLTERGQKRTLRERLFGLEDD